MPDTTVGDLTARWLKSLTLFSDVIWGVNLSNVYWTLMVEVKFYILTAIVIKYGMWGRRKYQLLCAWLALSFLNNFCLHDHILSTLLITDYAGHFCLGLMIYLVSCGEKNKSIPVIIAASLWLVYRNCIGYTTWIRGIYPELPYSDVDILFGVILIFAVFCLMVKVVEVGKTVKRMASLLGPLSYTFYLLHADFGYFIRTQYYKRLVVVFPGLLSFVNEGMIMCTAIAASFALALIVHIAVNKINGLFKKKPPT